MGVLEANLGRGIDATFTWRQARLCWSTGEGQAGQAGQAGTGRLAITSSDYAFSGSGQFSGTQWLLVRTGTAWDEHLGSWAGWRDRTGLTTLEDRR